jgi:hypothetical protein
MLSLVKTYIFAFGKVTPVAAIAVDVAAADDDRDSLTRLFLLSAFAGDLPCKPMVIKVTSKSAVSVSADDLFIPVFFLCS